MTRLIALRFSRWRPTVNIKRTRERLSRYEMHARFFCPFKDWPPVAYMQITWQKKKKKKNFELITSFILKLTEIVLCPSTRLFRYSFEAGSLSWKPGRCWEVTFLQHLPVYLSFAPPTNKNNVKQDLQSILFSWLQSKVVTTTSKHASFAKWSRSRSSTLKKKTKKQDDSPR